MEKKIEQTLFSLTGEKVDADTPLVFLANKNDMGVGDLLDSLCKEIGGVRVKNSSLPKTVGEIVLI